jgi:hypothetical protein
MVRNAPEPISSYTVVRPTDNNTAVSAKLYTGFAGHTGSSQLGLSSFLS